MAAERYAGEQILRCDGTRQALEKIELLLEECEAGGDLDMSFLHHKAVRKALVMEIERDNVPASRFTSGMCETGRGCLPQARCSRNLFA